MGYLLKKILMMVNFLVPNRRTSLFIQMGAYFAHRFIILLWLGWLNPCPAELFELYFSLFEAGIANAISSFK